MLVAALRIAEEANRACRGTDFRREADSICLLKSGLDSTRRGYERQRILKVGG